MLALILYPLSKFYLGSASRAETKIWIWMCCFQNQQDESDNYNENVEHIVEDLKSAHLKILLELKSEDGNGSNYVVVLYMSILKVFKESYEKSHRSN